MAWFSKYRLWFKSTWVGLFLLANSCSPTLENIRRLGAEGEQAELFELLEDERSWVREEAARSLSRIHTEKVARRLEELMQDGQERYYVRTAAIDSLGKIADPRSFELLFGMLSRPGLPPEMKIALIQAVCGYPEKPEALQAIAQLVDDDDLLVSAVAQSRLRWKCKK